MTLLYPNELLSCRYYDKGERASIQMKEIAMDRPFEGQAISGKIIFLLKGEIMYSYGPFQNCRIEEREILFLPPTCGFILQTKDMAEILIIRLSNKIQFCEHYLLESLKHQIPGIEEKEENRQPQKAFTLKINTEIEIFLSSLEVCVNKGFQCKLYFETKIKELFYLLKAFYYKEDLALFFREVLSSDSNFSQFVIHNHHKYKTLSEMAEDMGMSLSNIEKRFAQVFKMPGYRWMNQQKANRVYHALCTENTPLKELAMRFEFSSASSLNDFCKNMLGDTPGMIRKKNTGGTKL